MWRQFMREAHAYLNAPSDAFPKPADIVTSSCSGRVEVFKLNSQPTKPGACRAPPPAGSSPTPKPAPSPRFPPKNTPTPSPSPEATPTPAPTPETSPTPAPEVFYYTVENGDTLQSIAERFGTTPEEIARLNNLDPAQPLVPGTVLAIPVPPGNTNAAAIDAVADRRRLRF
jgi:LysM repeat protein